MQYQIPEFDDEYLKSIEERALNQNVIIKESNNEDKRMTMEMTMYMEMKWKQKWKKKIKNKITMSHFTFISIWMILCFIPVF